MSQQALLEKFAAGNTTPEDHARFNDWFHGLSEAAQQEVLGQYEQLLQHQEVPGIPVDSLAAGIAARINNHEAQQHRGIVVRIWSLAAAVVLIAVAGIWLFAINNKKQPPVVANTPVMHDAAPATQGAILTLADGKNVLLDSLGNGVVAQQSGSSVALNNGTLQYEKSGVGSREPGATYNTLQTPRGRQFQLVLPDGSKVWLNAASSITYPTVFAGHERKVKISGEAYFEVAKNKNNPFIVDVDGRNEVEVLGTHFNINSYTDESAIRTTLLEGKVKVSTTGSRLPTPDSRLLQPGEQAIITNHITITDQINIDEVMAWKNGRFSFQETDIKTIMRELSRWYDVDVVYEGTIPEKKYTADLSRQTKLSELLLVMEESNIHFTIEGKTLRVRR